MIMDRPLRPGLPFFWLTLALACGLLPPPALAHLVNTNVGEFYAGILHPLTSVEYLFPAVALALLAGRCGTQAARWMVVFFPLALIAGTCLGHGFTGLDFVHPASLVAIGWGAAHALTPGHGKAIVGAYLVGSRGTAGHALYLGLTVTMTHTIGVFALGLIALLASRYVLAEQLFPWLAAVSGVIVIALGASMSTTRLRPLLRRHVPHEQPHQSGHPHQHHNQHHDHRHEHGHHGHHREHSAHRHGHAHLPPGADGTAVTWRSLLGLGISGGLLPCPSALVLLLTAISLQRTGFGLLLLIAFSLGLGGVLTGVGLLFLKGSQLLQDAPRVAAVSRYVPAVSAMVILILGVGITVEAIWRLAYGG
jgi:ABC-type nickel/cobalt efflux system permease component RcnA